MTSEATSLSRDGWLRISILGAGRVGRVLGRRLVDRGLQLVAIASRSKESAERLASELGIDQAFDDLSEIPTTSNLLLICVPDSEIENVTVDLSALERDWNGTIVAHTSGALPASVLSPLEVRGAVVLSFHPLQAITAEASPSVLDSVYVGLEGNDQGVAVGEKLAAALGMKSVVIPTEAKPRYHLAAVMASNLFLAQIAIAEEVLRSVDLETTNASELLRPLVRGTLSNLDTSTVEDALTGPVVRGDLKTLEEHAKTLEAHFPHLIPAYVALSTEAVRLALRSGRLEPERADEVVSCLEQVGAK